MDLLKRIKPTVIIDAGISGMFFFVPVATSPTVICGTVTLAVWILSGRFLSDLRAWWRAETFLPILVLILLPWLGMLYTPVPSEGISLAYKSYYWLYALAIPTTLSLQKKPDRFIKMFLAGLALNSTISILQYVGIVPLKKGVATGLLGGSSAWIALSLFLTAGILMASFYFYKSDTNRRRLLYACLMLQYFIVLTFTGGRSGYIALIVLAPFVIYNFIGRKHIVKILILCVIGICLLFASPVVRSRFSQAHDDIMLYGRGEVNTSLGLRFQMWTVAWSAIKSHPIAGLGTAGFEKAWQTNKKDPSLPSFFHPHNSFIFMQVSYGVLGLAAFCRLLWLMLKKGWKDRDSAVGFAVFAFSSTFIIGSLSDTEVIVFATAVALPLFAGISQAQEATEGNA